MINGFLKKELHTLMWQRPQFAQIELTKNCNQSCSFCYRACESNKKYKDRDYKEWIKIIDILEQNGVSKIHFTGGEVLLFKDFEKILKHCKKKNLQIHINTNGTINVSKYINLVDEIVFSIHGFEQVHNNIVKNNNSFKNILNNIEIIKNNSNVSVCINMVLVKENFDDMVNIYEYFNNIISNFKFSPTIAVKANDGNDAGDSYIQINKENMKKYINMLDLIDKNKLVLKHGLHAIYKYTDDSNSYPIKLPVCAAGKDKIIIKYNGDVFPCNFFVSDEYYCGNIFESDFIAIWKEGKGFNKFRKIILDEKIPYKCKKCKNNICYSGCRVWTKSYINNKEEIENERDIRCEFTNAFIGD